MRFGSVVGRHRCACCLIEASNELGWNIVNEDNE